MLRRLQLLATVLMATLTLFLSTRASAVDGVIEINQVKALAGGLTPMDTAGFPVSINAPGSYRLTSDLAVTAESNGIDINASGVTVDLNGFSIVSAGGMTLHDGIAVTGQRVTVRNGTVRDFTRYGIFGSNPLGADGHRVVEVLVAGNDAIGINLESEGALVDRCIAADNGTIGILVTSGGLVLDSVARSNGNVGISASGGGYRGNALTNNNGGNANPQTFAGVNLGGNLCGAALCP